LHDLIQGNVEFELESDPSSKSATWLQSENLPTFFDEWARDNFGKHHEPGIQIRGHGEVALERSNAVSGADPRAEDEGVTVVEGGSWLDDD
jgi:hypothetical protein